MLVVLYGIGAMCAFTAMVLVLRITRWGNRCRRWM